MDKKTIQQNIEKEDKKISLELEKKRKKQKIYNSRAYIKRKLKMQELKMQEKNIKKEDVKNLKNQSVIKEIKSDNSVIFKINNTNQKEITIRIDV